MPKKKISKQAKKPAMKKASLKASSGQKPPPKTAVKKHLKPAKKSSARKSVAKPAASKQSVAKTTATKATSSSTASAANGDVSLGRPLVTQEEKLYMLFHDDYSARQVFEFLRVDTIKELEQFSQQQIVHMMSKPLRMTVDRIRQRLAEYKRSLKDDEQYAADFLKRGD